MIALVMCGGKGSRMESSEEKLLLKYKKPIIEHVLNALEQSHFFSKIICITSNNAPKTRQFVTKLGFEIMETEGHGYSEDLSKILAKFVEPVFVVSGDMPLLDPAAISKIMELVDSKNIWNSIIVRKNFLTSLGIDAEFFITINGEDYAYTGISVIDPTKIHLGKPVDEFFIIFDDKRVAMNLNTKKDYDLLCTA